MALISDEIYETITYGGHRHLSPLAIAPASAGAFHPGQQPLENLRDDRMARGILRRPRAADPGDVSGAGAIQPRSRDVHSGRGGGGAGRSAGLRHGNARGIFAAAGAGSDAACRDSERGHAAARRRLLRHGGCARIESAIERDSPAADARSWRGGGARRGVRTRRRRDSARLIRQRRRDSGSWIGPAARRFGVRRSAIGRS